MDFRLKRKREKKAVGFRLKRRYLNEDSGN